MAKLRSASRRISTTGSGWRHSQKAAEISATSATEKNKTMKPLSNQSSVCPRSRTTSRHAKPRATRTIPRPSMRSLPPFRLVSDPPEFTREVESARKGGRLRIDGLGIFLVALGFACLEVVLDRGQTE